MAQPQLIEVLVMAFLCAASVVLFLLRTRRVLSTIRGSRKEPGYSLQPIAPRLGLLIRNVLLQAKVIRQRPLPGLAHALVFWGFLAFALATLHHLAAGFGLELIPRESPFGRIYFAVVAVFAGAVAAGISALFFRRFLVKPKWLGKSSPESGFIALLIFALMITYLADYQGHHDAETAKRMWWIHTLCLLVFLPIIPHTKHLHLLLSPVTVFLARDGFSQIPPLEGDEDFGLDTGKDITRISALQAYSCVECGRCTEHCPAYNTGKELDPKEVVLGLRGYLNENGAAAELELIGKHLSQETAFQCTTCGACEFQCPVGVQHLPLIVGLRRGAVNTGKWEDEHGGKLFNNLERYGNPLGISARERDKFIESAGLPIFDGSQDYCLWLGCMGAYDPRGQATVTALARVLDFLGVSYGVPRREKCTGDAARRLGNDLAFEELATYNLEQFSKSNVARLLSICPHCVRTISVDWRDFGQAPPIEHHTEFLARNAARLPSDVSRNVVYHDPCYLGRYRGTYVEPREVLARHARVAEAPRHHDRSFCCGAGGGLYFLGEEKGKRVSVERCEELVATGASAIAVACPFCHAMFGDALGGDNDAPELLDVGQITAAAIPEQAGGGRPAQTGEDS